jgi:glutaconate CoA-transferase subunit B
VTDLAILDFDEDSRSMRVAALHPGVTPGQVQDNTGFEVLIDPHVRTTEPPQANELKVLRELDPERLYIA